MCARVICFFLIFIAFCANAQVPSYVDTNGLVGWWPFDGNANDYSGNALNGIVNGASLTTDRFGSTNSAYDYDGINDYIQVNANSNLDIQNTLSVSFWMWMDGGGCNPRVVSLDDCPGYGFAMYQTSNVARNLHSVSFGCNTSTLYYVNTSNTITSNSISSQSWQHVVVTFNRGIGEGKIYLNGVLYQVFSSSPFTSPLTYNNKNLYFGNINPTRCDWWGGKIDDFGLWNKVLDSTQVKLLYHANQCNLTFSFPQDTIVTCSQDSVMLDAGSGFTSYNWSNGDSTQTTYAKATGMYSVEVIDTNGCSATDSVFVNFIALNYDTVLIDQFNMTFNASYSHSTPSFHIDSTYLVKVNGRYGVADSWSHNDAAYNYAWDTSTNTKVRCNGTQDAQKSTYWLLNGNNIPFRPINDIDNNCCFCSGGNKEYVWKFQNYSGVQVFSFVDGGYSDNSGLLDFKVYVLRSLPSAIHVDTVMSCNTFVWQNGMTYNSSGVYSDTITNSQGCDSIVSLNLTINTLSYQLPQDTITSCNQDSVLLDAGVGFASYNWSNGDSSQTTYAKATGMYSVQVTDTNGCNAEDSVFVSIINGNILQNDTIICKGDSVSLSVSQLQPQALTICNGNNLPNNLQTGLVGYWPFCGNANDESGNGNNGTVNGATLTTDRFGNANSAYDFDGVNDYLDFGNPTLLNPTPFSYSQSCWIKLVDYSAIQDPILSKRHQDNGNDWATALIKSDGKVSFFSDDKQHFTTNFATSPVLDSSFWYQFTFVKNGYSYIMYMNGYLVDSIYDTHIMGGTNDNFIAGKQGAWNAFFKGKIDDIGIWNRALSASEVQQLYTSGSPQTYQWSTGDTTSTISVSPDSTTTYYVTISNGIHSCVDSVTVTVNNLQFQFAQDTITSCDEDSVMLDAGSGFASYNWSNGDSTQIAYANATGMYSVEVTDTNGCTAEDSVFVSIINDSILQNDTTICKGDSLSLSVSTIIGTYKASQVFCNGTPTAVVDVTNPVTGRTWMDRNLGATRVATSSTDAASYGDLYQWGRGSDGHQCRTSPTTNTLSSIDQPGNGNFILEPGVPYDWRSPQNTNLWQGVNGVNNPCPSGYRLPTDSELDAERISWSSNDPVGAFASPLKLTVAGYRFHGSGWLYDVGSDGYCWSSTVSTSNSRRLQFANSSTSVNTNRRATGYSIRCIKEIPSILQLLIGTNSYQWSTGDTTSSISVSPDSTTTYYVTISNGIHSCVDSVTVTVNNPQFQLPQDTITTCVQDSVLLDAGVGFVSYNWSNGDSTQITYAKATGMYSVEVTDTNGCTAEDSVFVSIIKDSILQNDTIICKGDSVSLSVGNSSAPAITICNSNNLPSNLQTGLVGYWPFCGNANDESGNGNNGTVNGAILTSDRNLNINSAYYFNGGSFIDVPNSSLLRSLTSEGTISAWSYSNVSRGSLVCKTNSNSAADFRIQYDSNSVSLIINGKDYYINHNFPVSQWFNLVMTYKNSTAKLYVNSIYIDSLAIPSNFWPISKTNNLEFGRDPHVITEYHNGKIDDIGIWNRALTDSEIQQLFSGSQSYKYAWSTGDTTSSISVAPDSTTTYLVTISNGIHSCVDSVTVFVNDPQFSFAQDSIAGCDTVTVNAGSGWSAYAWSSGDTNQSVSFTNTGMKVLTVTDSVGCTATDSIYVTVNTYVTTTVADTSCDQYTWSQTGVTYTMTGTYSDTIPTAVGCDSIIELVLTINVSDTVRIPTIACDSFTWPQTGLTYYTSGVYQDSLVNNQGCDSILLLDLTITQTTSSTISVAACDSFTWLLNGITYNLSGVYSDTITNSQGCDSIVSLNLTINTLSYQLPQDTITTCGQDSVLIDAGVGFASYNWSNGDSSQTTYAKATGMYSVQVTDTNGCSASDSVFVSIINDTILQNDTTICKGDSISLSVGIPQPTNLLIDSITIRMDSVWDYYFTNLDTTRNYLLKVNGLWANCCGHLNYDVAFGGITWSSISPVIWNSSAIYFHMDGLPFPRPTPDVYTTSHQYDYPLSPLKDSIEISFYDNPTTDNIGALRFRLFQLIDPSSLTYQWSTGDTTSSISVSPDSTTTYYVTISNGIHSCVDSVTVTVNNPQFQFAQDSVTGCDTVTVNAGSGWSSYSWSSGDTAQSVSFTTTGMKILTVTDSIGCTATDSIYMTVNTYVTTTMADTSCDQYTWSQTGVSYTMTGTYSDTIPTAFGCDSIINLNLVIYNLDTVRIPVVSCDSFTWPQTGLTYYTSGVYRDSLVNNQGCDSILLLDLTITQTTSSTISAAACDSFTWLLNGMTYNSSGVYSDTITNSQGCDSIVSLNLTINTLSYQLPKDTITSCGQDSVLIDASSGFVSYNWNNGDSTQTTYAKATGMYSVQVTDTNGCSAEDSVFVSIINDSIIQNDTTICKGDSVSLSVNLISFPLNFNGCVSSSAPYFGTWSLITPVGIYTNLIRKDSIFYSRSNNDVFKSNFINGPWISLNFATQTGITSPGNVIDMLEFDWGGNLFVSTAHNDLYSFDGINWNSKGLSGFGCSGAFMKKLMNNRIIVSKWGYLRDLYISDNNGTSWTNVTNGGTNDYFDIELANNGNIFVASTSGLIKKSTNNGSNWTLINSQLALSVPSCFGIEKDCDGNLYAIGNNKLYKSIDDGTTWVYLNPVPAIGVNEFEITSNGDFYIFINNNGFYRSSNQGVSWSLVTGLPINLNGRVRNLKQVDDKLLLITSQGIYAKSITQNNSVFWSTGDTTSSISVSPDSTTTYYVTISNGIHSCVDSVTVTVNNPQFQFAQDSVTGCDTVTVNAGAGWSTYSWSSGDTTQSVSFTTTGMKVLTVTDSIGCAATDSVYVTVNTYVTTTIADTSCDQYTWSQTGITYGTSGIYRDTVSTAVGCDSILELVLTITNSSFSSDTVVACESYTWPQTGVTYFTTGIYFDTMVNAVGCDSILALDLTINFSTSSIINQTACDSFTWSLTGLTYFVSGTYPDTLLNARGCDSVVFLNLLVYPTITPIIGNVQNMCENDPIVSFTASPSGGIWSGPGISATGSFDPTFAGVGVHTIVYTAAGQCANSDTVTIEVYDVPMVNDLIKDDECDEGIGSIEITLTGGIPPYSYVWSNGKTTKDNLRLKEGTYSLTVTDSNGCIENYVGSLLNLEDDSCDDTYLFVPNVFSPDGNGVNDVLYVDGKNILAVNLQIYNRWGNLVFESNSLSKGWDGTYKGQPVNQGVFVYLVTGRYKDGEEFEQKGTITVVR